VVNRIFQIGLPSQELFLSIVMLNALSGELSNVRDQVATALSNSDQNRPFTADDIRKRLDTEQQIVNSESNRSPPLTALAARMEKGRRSTKVCSNCKAPGHLADECWQPGGGMEGRREEVLAAKKKRTEHAPGRTGGRSTQPQVTGATSTRFDERGKAFVLDSTTGEAFYLAKSSSSNRASPSPTKEPAPLPAESYLSLPADHIEYKSYHLDEDLRAGVDWREVRRSDKDMVALSESSIAAAPYFLDTGATVHITPARSDYMTFKTIAPRCVRGVGGSTIEATGIGTVKLPTSSDAALHLENVLYIPNATVRLISVSDLCRSLHLTAHFDETSCWLTVREGRRIASGKLTPRRLYALDDIPATHETALLAQRTPNLETWHRRLGHANLQSIVDMAQKSLAEGMPIDLSTLPPRCEHCILGKQVKNPVPKVREGVKASRRLGVVWADLSGPHDVKSSHGNLYVIDIVDDHTSYPWSFPIPSKDMAFQTLLAWERSVELETGQKVGIYRTDNGELKTNEMAKWLASRGTKHQFTAPYTSSHIGRVERLHLTLMNKARTMRISCGLPPKTWDEFYATAAYLTARTSTTSLAGKTPFEAWHNVKPNLSHLREIGCRAFVLIQNAHVPKIYGRSIECVLVGYQKDAKAY
jgi:hypothetical protein